MTFPPPFTFILLFWFFLKTNPTWPVNLGWSYSHSSWWQTAWNQGLGQPLLGSSRVHSSGFGFVTIIMSEKPRVNYNAWMGDIPGHICIHDLLVVPLWRSPSLFLLSFLAVFLQLVCEFLWSVACYSYNFLPGNGISFPDAEEHRLKPRSLH